MTRDMSRAPVPGTSPKFLAEMPQTRRTWSRMLARVYLVLTLIVLTTGCVRVTRQGEGRYRLFSSTASWSRVQYRAKSICKDYQPLSGSSQTFAGGPVDVTSTRHDTYTVKTSTHEISTTHATPVTTTYKAGPMTITSLEILCPNGTNRQQATTSRRSIKEGQASIAAGRQRAAELVERCVAQADEATCVEAVHALAHAISPPADPAYRVVYERACASSRTITCTDGSYHSLAKLCGDYGEALCSGYLDGQSVEKDPVAGARFMRRGCELDTWSGCMDLRMISETARECLAK